MLLTRVRATNGGVKPTPIYPQNGAAGQNSCFESEREKKSYKSI